MSRNQLKLAILNSNVPQYVLAAKAGMSETKLSRVVRGRADPTEDERRRIAKALGVSEDDLFGCRMGVVA